MNDTKTRNKEKYIILYNKKTKKYIKGYNFSVKLSWGPRGSWMGF